jgi:hypothetical protein
MLTIGEIRTSLLRHSPSLSIDGARQLLDLAPGRPVLFTERPEVRVVSPELSFGVDCGVTTPGYPKTRGIGTVGYQAAVVGGTVVQASAFTRLERVHLGKRQPWSHYAAQRHVVEFHGRASEAQVQECFLESDPVEDTLNLGEICARLLRNLRSRPPFPRKKNKIPLHASATSVRWAVQVGDIAPQVTVRVRGDKTRTLDIAVSRSEDLATARRFCEDYALHDWLAYALREAARQAEQRSDDVDEYTEVLGAAIERLAPLWIPGAHLGQDPHSWWEALERQAGYSRQWELRVTQIRDRLMVQTLRDLHALGRPLR